VAVKLNLTMAQMEEAANQFLGSIRPSDVVIFYYSGHGIQVGDQNYLIPIDFDARTALIPRLTEAPGPDESWFCRSSGALLFSVRGNGIRGS
jgi:hypothetical protein